MQHASAPLPWVQFALVLAVTVFWGMAISLFHHTRTAYVTARRQLLSGALLALCLCGVGRLRAWDAPGIAQKMQQKYGAAAVQRLQGWFALLQRLQGHQVQQQMKAVNDFWNQQLLAEHDQRLWGESDYWATPFESLGRGAGDCEDFVIGKYFSLVRLGVPPQKMRLIYVRARIGGPGSTQSIAHMVLGFYEQPQSEPLVLDNLMGSISKAAERPDLTPVFSFDAEAVYVNGARSASSERINRWQGVLARMREEGFDV